MGQLSVTRWRVAQKDSRKPCVTVKDLPDGFPTSRDGAPAVAWLYGDAPFVFCWVSDWSWGATRVRSKVRGE
ncbi:MAG: hypothetical protein WCP21_12810 [Armatimonadota bacterium]